MVLAYYYILIFILGITIGSFLNVCIYRIPLGKSIAYPPSACGSCGKRLGVLDLVPVFSYLLLKGKCRYCGKSISARYICVELITGAIYCLLFWRYSFSVEFIMSIYLMSLLLVVFFIDAEHKIIPNGLVITGILGSLPFVVYNFFIPIRIYGGNNWWEPFAGIIPGTAFLLIVMLAGIFIYKSDEVMGMGDVKIFIPIGLFLGWKLCAIALLASIISGGLIGLLLMISGIKKRRDTIAFAPFITAGTFVALMWGHELINWYFGRLS